MRRWLKYILLGAATVLIAGYLAYLPDGIERLIAPTLELDFRTDQSLESLTKAFPIEIQDDGLLACPGKRNLKVHCPSGITYEGYAPESYLVVRDGLVTGFMTLGNPRTLMCACQDARELLGKYHYDAKPIEDWNDKYQELSSGAAPNFGHGFRGREFNLFVEIRHTYSDSHPWYVVIEHSFDK